MNEAYVLLNVDYKNQNEIIDKVKHLSVTKAVKTVYGIRADWKKQIGDIVFHY